MCKIYGGLQNPNQQDPDPVPYPGSKVTKGNLSCPGYILSSFIAVLIRSDILAGSGIEKVRIRSGQSDPDFLSITEQI